MKIFLDVDNTILEHYNFYNKKTESRTHRLISEDVLQNKEALNIMYSTAFTSKVETIRKLFELDNVYILTKCPNVEFDYYKQNKLSQSLGIKIDDLLSRKDKNGINKYLTIGLLESKIEYVKKLFEVEDVSDYILVDDYSENILQWESEGGIGIKYYNEYNSPHHPSLGISIRDFKIFEIDNLNGFLLQYNNPFIANILFNESDSGQKFIIDTEKKQKIINLSKEIYKDVLNNLNIKENKITANYKYLNFIKEYYDFMKEADNDYWYDFFKNFKNNNELIIYKSLLNINYENLFFESNIDRNDYLTLKILTNKDETTNDYDIYVTIDENNHYIDLEGHLKRVFENIQKIIRNEF